MYKKVSTNLDFVEREKEITAFWKEHDVFRKSTVKNEGGPEFSFFDGPPTANGKPHIGHILTRVMKDIIPRYKVMKGYHVLRKAGWDTHGLPVELEVEKSLGLDGKQEIEKYGIEPFIKKCKESVWKYKGEWEVMSDRVGYWVDMDNPYITYDDKYIESVWWSLKEVDKKGLLYKGYKIVPYCPRCGTALSSHEVAQGYKDVKETSIFVKFRIKGETNAYFLAWTTTPWTLPSNTALCMNPDENYVRIHTDDCDYVLAEALVPSLFEEGTYSVVSTRLGKEYEYVEYEPLFDWYEGKEKRYFVTCDGYVTLTDGSGIVHIAPAFGEDDSNVGKAYNLPFIQMVNERGRFIDGCGDLTGRFVKDCDKDIIKDLAARGLLFKELQYEHSYPFCWRCDTPLLYYARNSWFIKMTAVKENLIRNNNSINWMPASIKSGRMGNFLENVIDWGISRERYWGTPLPFWICPDCGKRIVIGSREELVRLSGRDVSELHKPYIDQVEIKCECGGTMKRTPGVLDCWYDSGSMPFAQYHYPFENKEVFEEVYPADFISEAVDQTRGWFYTLLAISTLLFDKAPFKNCIVLGHVNDKNGIKMSKHKGNVVDPFSVLDKQGADAVRWYFYTASAPWLPSRFSADNVSEAQRKFMGTLWNTYAFFVLYADIDEYDPSKYSLKDCKLTLMDRWILSGLNTLIATVDSYLDVYKITEASRAIAAYVDELSNWYVRRSRERYWGKGMDDDKVAAYTTLYTVLVELSKVCAPFVPFMAENIYQNLVTPFYPNAPESVHLCDFPVSDASYIDKDLENDMELTLQAVVLGRACRNKANIKNRQPLSEMYVKTDSSVSDMGILDLAADELNVKKLTLTDDDSQFVSYEVKPQLKTLGPKYGKQLGEIRQYLATCDTKALVTSVREKGMVKVQLPSGEVELAVDDLLISTISRNDFVAESDGGMTVVLATTLTPELIEEGICRELVSRIQTMRKDAGFEVTDHIILGYEGTGEVADVLARNASICADVLADELRNEIDGYQKEVDLADCHIVLSVKRIND